MNNNQEDNMLGRVSLFVWLSKSAPGATPALKYMILTINMSIFFHPVPRLPLNTKGQYIKNMHH